MLHDPDDTLNNIVHIGEIPLAVAVIEDLDGLSLPQLVCKTKISHIRPAGGTINGEEPQSRGGNIIELAVGMGQQFIGLLGGRIQGNRIIHLLIGGIGHFFVGTIDTGGAGVHQMLHRTMPACLQNVVKADDIGLDISIRIGDGIANTRLGRQVHHHLRMEFFKNIRNQNFICQIPLDKLETGILGQFCQTILFQSNIVVIIDTVQANNTDIFNGFKQPLGQIGADKAGSAGYQYRLTVQVHIVIQHPTPSHFSRQQHGLQLDQPRLNCAKFVVCIPLRFLKKTPYTNAFYIAFT